MTRSKIKFITPVFLAVFLAGCGDNSNPAISGGNVPGNSATNNPVSISLNRAWENFKEYIQPGVDYTFDKQSQFVKNAAADLSELDRKIQELSEKIAAAAVTNAQANLGDLRGQRAILYEKLNNVKEATADDWDDAKAEFQKTENDLKSSLKKLQPGAKGEMTVLRRNSAPRQNGGREPE